MKLFWKSIATVLFYVISGALLVYAGSRSLDFIVQTLPPEQQIIGYLALAATSGGMIAWLLVFMYKAEGLGQKVTAGIMVVVDMLGEFALFTMDTLYQTGEAGMTAKMLPDEIQMVILGMSGLIALNIMATVAFHLVEPEHIKAMREGFVKDKLENDALNLVEKRGNELAHTLAPKIAEQWAADFEARFSDMNSIGLGTLKTSRRPALAAPQSEPVPDDGNMSGLRWPWQQPKPQPVIVQTEAVNALLPGADKAPEVPAQDPLPLQGMSHNGHAKK